MTRMAGHRWLWLFGVVLLALLAAPVHAADDKGEKARQHYQKSKEAYGRGDFAEAIRQLQAAYDLTRSPELLYNIARAHERAGNLQEAVNFYERYLKESKDAQDRAAVEATIKSLKERLAPPPPKEDKKDPAKEAEEKKRAKEEEAAAHFKKGRELYQAGNYKEALAELNRAFDILPSATLVYNMAKTREKMGDISGALKDYRTYLQMEPNAPDKGDVQFLIKALEKKLRSAANELTLESNPPGAEVYLDGSQTLTGQTPLSMRLPPGEHSIKVQKNGFEVSSRQFTMPDDRDLTLTFDLRPIENLGYLSVDCEQDGAHIFLDGTTIALTPYKERRAVSAGKHQVVLEREGYKRFSQVVDIEKGKESRLKVSLESNESRSRAPVVLGPLLGIGIFGIGAVGAVLSTSFALRASRSVDGTQAYLMSLVGFAVGEIVAVVVMLTGVLLGAGLVVLWIVLGVVGGGADSSVTVTPADATAPAEAPAPSPSPAAPAAAPAPAPDATAAPAPEKGAPK